MYYVEIENGVRFYFGDDFNAAAVFNLAVNDRHSLSSVC